MYNDCLFVAYVSLVVVDRWWLKRVDSHPDDNGLFRAQRSFVLEIFVNPVVLIPVTTLMSGLRVMLPDAPVRFL